MLLPPWLIKRYNLFFFLHFTPTLKKSASTLAYILFLNSGNHSALYSRSGLFTEHSLVQGGFRYVRMQATEEISFLFHLPKATAASQDII